MISKKRGQQQYSQNPVLKRRQVAQAQRLVAQYATIPRPMSQRAGLTRHGAEIKAIDIPDGTYGFNRPNAGVVSLLNGVQTGTGFFNRIGSRIEMRSLKIRGFIYYASTTIQDQCRMIIVYDRQPTQTLPAPTVILQTRDQIGNATNPGSSEINLDNRDRFQILRDYQVHIPSCTVAAGVLTNGPSYSDQKMQVDIYLKLKSLTTHFNSTSNPATIANIATGALYAMFISDTQDATVGFNGQFRLRYSDV